MEPQNFRTWSHQLYPHLCGGQTEAHAPPPFDGVWEGDFLQELFEKILQENKKLNNRVKAGVPQTKGLVGLQICC